MTTLFRVFLGTWFCALALTYMVFVPRDASGRLIDRGNGLLYDDVLNVTWTQNASLSDCRPAGADKWGACLSWADGLVHAGFDDWRLASMDVNGDGIIVECAIVPEAECRDNEYGYMFYYNLGGRFGDDKSGNQTTSTGVTVDSIHRVYRFGNFDYFDFRNGWFLQGAIGTAIVWAVRAGDVAIEIPVDIKPQTCPNPINVKSNGKVPVALLGTTIFDVTTVDPASVRLAGIAPAHYSFADVATPFEPFTGKDDALSCTTLGADGFVDIDLQFETQEIIHAVEVSLGRAVIDGESLALPLTATLLQQHGNAAIIGEDILVIQNKGTGGPK